jgi:hypothetical protein
MVRNRINKGYAALSSWSVFCGGLPWITHDYLGFG